MEDGAAPRGPTPEERRGLARLAVPAGLCATCASLRVLASPRSVFVRCGLADTDPAYPRYPGLPVARCRGYEAAEGDAAVTRDRNIP